MYPAHGLLFVMEPRLPINQLHEMGLMLHQWLSWRDKAEGAYVSTEVLRNVSRRFWGSELAMDFSTYDGKALAAVRIQDREHAKESLVLCDYMSVFSSPLTADHVGDPTLESQLFSAATGTEMDEEGFYKVGERIFNLQRAILVRERKKGPEGDRLPEFMYSVPMKAADENPDCIAPGKDGEVISRKEAVVDRREFEKMRDEFYRLRGWDVRTGLQTKVRLAGLGLHDVASDLASRGLAI